MYCWVSMRDFDKQISIALFVACISPYIYTFVRIQCLEYG